MANFVTACHDCNNGKGTDYMSTAETQIAVEEFMIADSDGTHLFFDGDPWLASFYGGIVE